MSTHQLSFREKAWRLSPMYLFYFTLFGTFLPYIARFLTTKGLTEQEVSIVVAVVNVVNVFAPFLFSYLSDKLGRRMVFIRLGYFAIGVFYIAALAGSGFWFYLAVFGLFGTFLSAVLPQMEAVALEVLGEDRKRYGQIRLWGSLGFVAIVWLMGFMLDMFSVDILPKIGLVFAILMFASTYLIKDKPSQQPTALVSAPLSTGFSVHWWQVALLLIVIVLWQFGMAPYNTFFDLYMRAQGYKASTIGFLISFGTFCEILIFIVIFRLYQRFSEKLLMITALLFTALRWFLLANFPESFAMVMFSQSIHALTFGVVHSVAVHRIGHLFPAKQAGLAQGLYVAIGTGVGLSVGNLIAGYFWTGSGIVFMLGAAFCVVAAFITFVGFRDTPAEETNKV